MVITTDLVGQRVRLVDARTCGTIRAVYVTGDGLFRLVVLQDAPDLTLVTVGVSGVKILVGGPR